MARERVLNARGQTIIVTGPVSHQQLAGCALDPGLTAFRPPQRQHEALLDIVTLPGGRVVVALDGTVVVGYVCFHPPEPFERWYSGSQGDVLELSIEVAAPYRGAGVARALLRLAIDDPALERYIILSTEYYWHWDLTGTGLSLIGYRDVLTRLFGSIGLQPQDTDEPEIASHPANMLMVRFGREVPPERRQAFASLLWAREGSSRT